MKHKHCELIKAWADGAEIEFFDVKTDKWWGQDSPFWYEDFEYRIKPEPKPDVYCKYHVSQDGKVMWSERPKSNLKLTFDGETGELKSAEILK